MEGSNQNNQYTVSYQILVDAEQSAAAVNKFVAALEKLNACTVPFEKVKKDIQQLNECFATLAEKNVTLKTEVAKQQLQDLCGLATDLRALLTDIPVTTIGKAARNRSNSASSTPANAIISAAASAKSTNTAAPASPKSPGKTSVAPAASTVASQQAVQQAARFISARDSRSFGGSRAGWFGSNLGFYGKYSDYMSAAMKGERLPIVDQALRIQHNRKFQEFKLQREQARAEEARYQKWLDENTKESYYRHRPFPNMYDSRNFGRTGAGWLPPTDRWYYNSFKDYSRQSMAYSPYNFVPTSWIDQKVRWANQARYEAQKQQRAAMRAAPTEEEEVRYQTWLRDNTAIQAASRFGRTHQINNHITPPKLYTNGLPYAQYIRGVNIAEGAPTIAHPYGKITAHSFDKLPRNIAKELTLQNRDYFQSVLGKKGWSVADYGLYLRDIDYQNQLPNRSATSSNKALAASRRGASRTYVAPKNIGYKLLGPTPLPDNGGMMIGMLKSMGIAYGISGVGQAVGEIVNQAVEFDNTMKNVENILKSHDKSANFASSFAGMTNTIRNVGMETKYKTTEVADAAKFLAMAGLNVDAINQAIRPIADIALIGDTDLGATADMVTNIMTAYNIAPNNMRRAADVMTNTFTMSNTTLTEIAEAYKYSASLLSSGGVGFGESAAAIGVLGDAGIKGSQAGTTLRTILANVLNPTKKQAKAWNKVGIDTKNKTLIQIFEELNQKDVSVSQFYQLFHKTAAAGAVALADHVDKWNKIIEENFMSEGMSKDLADEKKNTIKGLWAQLTSIFTDDGVNSFQLIQENIRSILKQGIEWLKTDSVQQGFHKFAKELMDLGHTLIGATKYFLDFYEAIAPLLKVWIKFQLVMWPITSAFKAVSTVMLGWAAVAGKAAVGIKGLASSFLLLGRNMRLSSTTAFLSSSFLGRGGLWLDRKLRISKGLSLLGERTLARQGTALYAGPAGWLPGITHKQQIAATKGLNLTRPKLLNKSMAPALTDAERDVANKAMIHSYREDRIKYNRRLMAAQFRNGLSTAGQMVGGAALMGLAVHQVSKEDSNTADKWSGAFYGLGGMALMAGGPVGWTVAGIMAVAGALIHWRSCVKKADEAARLATEAHKKYVANLKTIDGINFGDNATQADKYFQIVYNRQLSTNEALAEHVRLIREQMGLMDSAEEKENSKKLFKDTHKEAYDSFITYYGSQESQEKNALAFENPNRDANAPVFVRKYTGAVDRSIVEGKIYSFKGVEFDDLRDRDALYYARALYKLGADLSEGSKAQKTIALYRSKAYSANSLVDFNNILQEGISQTSKTPFDEKTKYVNSSYFDSLTNENYEKSYWKVKGFTDAVTNALNTSNEHNATALALKALGEILGTIDNGGKPTDRQLKQFMLNSGIDVFNDERYGAFKAPEWLKNMGYDTKLGKWTGFKVFDANGKEVGYVSADEARKAFNNFHQQIIDLIAQLSPQVKRYLESYANDPVWAFGTVGTEEGTGLSKQGQLFKTKGGEFYKYNDGFWYPSNEKGEIKNWMGNSDADFRMLNGLSVTPKSPRDPFIDEALESGYSPGGSGGDSYKSNYHKESAAPKQVIVNIENLMSVDTVDLANPDKKQVIDNLRAELAQTLVDVVHDFDKTWHA